MIIFSIYLLPTCKRIPRAHYHIGKTFTAGNTPYVSVHCIILLFSLFQCHLTYFHNLSFKTLKQIAWVLTRLSNCTIFVWTMPPNRPRCDDCRFGATILTVVRTQANHVGNRLSWSKIESGIFIVIRGVFCVAENVIHNEQRI